MRAQDGGDMSETPERNIHTALEYIAATYGDEMTYWEHTDEHPAQLPVHEREAWHRDAWDREQVELGRLTHGGAGHDSPGHPRNFGYDSPGVVHEI